MYAGENSKELLDAVKSNDLDLAESLIQENKFLLHTRDPLGRNLVHLAAKGGKVFK